METSCNTTKLAQHNENKSQHNGNKSQQKQATTKLAQRKRNKSQQNLLNTTEKSYNEISTTQWKKAATQRKQVAT